MPTTSQLTISRPQLSRYLSLSLLALLGGLVLYREAIAAVLTDVLNRSDSSHGIFVPPLVIFFMWTRLERIREYAVEPYWPGWLLVIAASILPLSGIGNVQVQFIAYIFFICGLVLALLGKPIFGTMAFPILFLVTMTPLPSDLYSSLADISRTVAFGGSLKIISFLGIPYLRIGWDIELPNAILRVAESCSGIRYLISFLVFGLAYAYLHKTTVVGRIATVLAMIPISLFASVCRLTVIFVMTYWVSPFWSQPKPHVVLSWFVFFTVLFAGIFIDQWVQRRRAKRIGCRQ